MERPENNSPKVVDEDRIVILKNIMSTSVSPPPSGFTTRLQFWEKATGRKAEKCAHEICNRPATEGAISRRAFSSDKTAYVFPACETCARRTEMLYVKGPLVPLD